MRLQNLNTPLICVQPSHTNELQPRLGGAFTVPFGQATFDAEGSEVSGPYFSRVIHWPGGRSGVTIGRGYDMGQRTPLQIQRELAFAGVPPHDAAIFSLAAGLRGPSAERFVREHRTALPAISPAAQRRLFEAVTTVEVISDIQRILAKPDLVNRYGAVVWSELPEAIRELVFDLRYRGDYTPAVRERIQSSIVGRDLPALLSAIEDREYWRGLGVPPDRIERRIEILRCQTAALKAA